MERETLLLKEGALIFDRTAAACKLCHKARENLLEAHDCVAVSGKKAASLGEAKRSDLRWWATFLPTCSMMSQTARSHYTTITSDASGLWGCGAFTSSVEWFQFEWPGPWREDHRIVKELLPIVLALAI